MDTPVPTSLEQVESIAIVHGKAIAEIPHDLYIPPDALEVILEAFSGPLDLLLYLIKRQNLDILDIPIASITRQYIEYIELMKDLRLELAAEYLVMAAMLAEIKSRMLLPRPTEEEGDEEDPRAELVRRLQEYERFQKAAENLSELPRLERDNFLTFVAPPERQKINKVPDVEFKELLFALKDILKRAELVQHHHIKKEPLSIRERMTVILDKMHQGEQFFEFSQCFRMDEGRMGVVVTFIAILELLKQSLVKIVQTENFGQIHLSAVTEPVPAYDEVVE